MKRLFLTLLLAILLIEGITPQQVSAQTPNIRNANDIRNELKQEPVDTQYDNTTGNSDSVKNDYAKTLNQQSTADKATADKQAQDATNTTNNRLGGGTAGGLLAMFKIVTSPIRGILTIALSILNLALTLAGLLFELVMKLTVLDMKSTVDSINIIPVIHKSIRDFANMFFIFFLLFESIKLIIGYSDTKKIRTMLIHLIVASLLMNFSLFITKAVIDVSNIAAVGFYQQLPSTKASDSAALGTNSSPGLGGAIMQVLKVPSIYDTSNIGDDVTFIAGALGGIVVMVILIFFFFVAGYLFIVRFVGLLGLMIFSPLMVAGWVLPQLDTYSKEWWKKLTEYCMSAPVFMMLTWVAFKIIQDPGFIKIMQSTNKVSGGSLFTAFTGPTLDSVLIIVNFCIIIGLLAMAVMYAASTGKHGEAAIKFGQKQMGWIGAKTAGRFGSYLDDKIGNTSWGNSEAGRLLRSGTTGLMAKSKYYGAKSYSEMEKEDKTLDKDIKEKSRNIDLKSRFSTAVNSGKSTEVAGVIKNMSVKEVVDLGAKKLNDPTVLAVLNDSHFDAIEKSDKFTEQEKVEISAARYKPIDTAIANADTAKLKEILNKMNAKQIISLGVDRIKSPLVLANLNDSHFDAIEKSEKFTDQERETINTARYKPLIDAISNNNQAEISNILKRMNQKQVEKLSTETLENKNFVSALSSGQFLELLKASNLTRETKDKIQEARTQPLTQAIAAKDAPKIQAIISGWKANEVAKLSTPVLTNPTVIQSFNIDILSSMIRENTPETTRDQIRTYMNNVTKTAAGNTPFDKAKDWLSSVAGSSF